MGVVVGDLVAVTAARYRKLLLHEKTFTTEDELKRIQSISGTTITLGSVNDLTQADSLAFGHVREISGMPVYAANLTRNIVFRSEGGDSIPAAQRGHFMVIPFARHRHQGRRILLLWPY